MAKEKALLLGFVVGGIISAGTTLLSAPKAGKELRMQVKNQGLEWRNTLQTIKYDGQRLKDQIVETSKEGVEMMVNLSKEMKESITEWKSAVEPHQKNIHKYLEQIEASMKELEKKAKSE